MNILIAFTTTEGQTRKIARAMQRTVETAGHAVTLHDCAERTVRIKSADFDAVILAASVHHRRYQSALYDFVAAHLAALQQKPVAFVSVSLSVTLASGEAEAQEYVSEFISETGLSVDAVHLAEGAIRYFEYSRSEASTIDLVVFKGQKTMPERNANPEYTDWAALEAFVMRFVDQVTREMVADATRPGVPPCCC